MFFFRREEHENLRGGNGLVVTYTKKIYFLGIWPIGKLIILNLWPNATIGLHKHDSDAELYITFSKNIRFCENKKWKMFNYCKRGNRHSAKNISNKRAKIFAFKF